MFSKNILGYNFVTVIYKLFYVCNINTNIKVLFKVFMNQFFNQREKKTKYKIKEAR